MSNRGGKCPRCGAVEGGGYLVVWQRNVSFSASMDTGVPTAITP